MFILLLHFNTSQQQSVYASSLKTSDLKQEDKQNLNQDNLCHRFDGCKQSNEGQQITGNDNTASGFNDQSTTNTSSLSSNSAASSLGTQGPSGTNGAQGPAGPPPTLQVIERDGAEVILPVNGALTATAECEPGEKAMGGGYDFTFRTSADDHTIFEESALPDNTEWQITARNN